MSGFVKASLKPFAYIWNLVWGNNLSVNHDGQGSDLSPSSSSTSGHGLPLLNSGTPHVFASSPARNLARFILSPLEIDRDFAFPNAEAKNRHPQNSPWGEVSVCPLLLASQFPNAMPPRESFPPVQFCQLVDWHEFITHVIRHIGMKEDGSQAWVQMMAKTFQSKDRPPDVPVPQLPDAFLAHVWKMFTDQFSDLLRTNPNATLTDMALKQQSINFMDLMKADLKPELRYKHAHELTCRLFDTVPRFHVNTEDPLASFSKRNEWKRHSFASDFHLSGDFKDGRLKSVWFYFQASPGPNPFWLWAPDDSLKVDARTYTKPLESSPVPPPPVRIVHQEPMHMPLQPQVQPPLVQFRSQPQDEKGEPKDLVEVPLEGGQDPGQQPQAQDPPSVQVQLPQIVKVYYDYECIHFADFYYNLSLYTEWVKPSLVHKLLGPQHFKFCQPLLYPFKEFEEAKRCADTLYERRIIKKNEDEKLFEKLGREYKRCFPHLLIVVRYVAPVNFLQNLMKMCPHKLQSMESLLPYQAGFVGWNYHDHK